MAKWTKEDKDRARSLSRQGWTRKQISQEMGVPAGTLYSWLKDPPLSNLTTEETRPREAVRITPPDSAADEVLGRDAEMPPQRPTEGRVVQLAPQPGQIDFLALEGHIAGLYVIGAKAVEGSDPVLANVVHDHANKAGHAWVVWIKSEPRVLALIEKLQIGTPLGELIGVHVTIVFAYVFARDAARRMASAAAQAAAEQDGAASNATEDNVGFATG